MRLSVARQYVHISGRLSRRRFNHGALFLLLPILCWLALPAGPADAVGIWPPLLLLLALVLLAIPRLHDTGLSAAWLILLLVPLAGPLWLVWRLCFRRGMTEENRFGADPAAPSPDYLVVS